MNFGTLALVVAAGLLGPFLASFHRLGPPVIVGEIAAGVVIGKSGFDWIDTTDPLLAGLAAIGFALLMFIVGTHLPVRDRRLRSALGRGAAIAATVGVGAVCVALLFGTSVGLQRPAILAVLLATSSGAVALPLLQELGSSDRKVLVATAWIAVADVATVLALPVVLATGHVARIVLGGVIVVLVASGMFAAAVLTRDRAWVERVRSMSREKGWGLDLRVSLLALFVCAWIATEFGTSILIAGFAVGAVVALLGEPNRVAQQLIGIGEGFAIPLFFVHLGAQIDLEALLRSSRALTLAAVIAGFTIVVHVAAALVWRLHVGFGLLASAQLGVPSAVVSIGLATEQLTAAQGAALMAALLVSLAACSIGNALLDRAVG